MSLFVFQLLGECHCTTESEADLWLFSTSDAETYAILYVGFLG